MLLSRRLLGRQWLGSLDAQMPGDGRGVGGADQQPARQRRDGGNGRGGEQDRLVAVAEAP